MAGKDRRRWPVRLPVAVLAELEAEAARQGRSLSAIVRDAWRIARPVLERFPVEPAQEYERRRERGGAACR